jgi:DNA-directed RNA polymerase specialized sigma24 family protein
VLQEIGIVLCSKSNTELERISQYFNFWCARTIMNMSSRKGVVGRIDVLIDGNVEVSDTPDIVEESNITEMANQANKILAGMPWYDRELFKVYLQEGSFRNVAKATKLPLSSVYSSISQVQIKLRKQIK